MTPPAAPAPRALGETAARTARVRRARPSDTAEIVTLIAGWAAKGLLLPRAAADVAASLDNYVVAVDAAVREYAPSLAEVVSVAVARSVQGGGLGARMVAAAERLARVRGHREVFAHTRNPEFFAAIGYECVDRGLYPEKRGRVQSTCVRRKLGRISLSTVVQDGVRRDGVRQAA